MLRRALRHTFTILSALSLLLCVVLAVYWMRSYPRDPVTHPYILRTGVGGVYVSEGILVVYRSKWHPYAYDWRPWDIRIPVSAAISAGLVLPIIAAVARVRRNARAGIGLCVTCGYDLRAHTGGELCPECGTPVPSAA